MHDDRAFCKRCRYELTGLAGRICPECGRPFDPARRATFTRHPRLLAWRRHGPVALLGVLGAATVYVASYYCLVEVDPSPLAIYLSRFPPVVQSGIDPVGIIDIGDSAAWRNGGDRARCIVSFPSRPTYRMGGNIATVVYGPIHEIDRKLRPIHWSVFMGEQLISGTTREHPS